MRGPRVVPFLRYFGLSACVMRRTASRVIGTRFPLSIAKGVLPDVAGTRSVLGGGPECGFREHLSPCAGVEPWCNASMAGLDQERDPLDTQWSAMKCLGVDALLAMPSPAGARMALAQQPCASANPG